MDLRMIYLLSGIVCVSFAQQINTGIWTVDEEPTNNMNVEGMTFFHEKPLPDSHKKKSESKNTQNGGQNLLYAFSHFMPDQSKLSLAAGLSRAADKVKMGLKDNFNIYDFAPKDKSSAPFTSEIVGNSNQPSAKPQWMSNIVTGNDAMSDINSQQIELSQLGIIKENVADRTNIESDITEINYLNTGTNVFADSNFFANSPTDGGTFPTSETVDITNNFDNAAKLVDNSFASGVNNNAYIFNDELSPPDIPPPAQEENSIFKLNLQNENTEHLVRDFPTNFLATSPNSSESLSNRNQPDSSPFGNSVDLEIPEKDTVKPFPFGQIHGNTEPIKNKRMPTLEIKSNFVDNSRKPMLRVQSKFVDMSGRQNPKMETIGSFVDTSKPKKNQQTEDNKRKQTTILSPITKPTIKPFSTMSSPTIKTSPDFIGPIQQGVPGSNTNQVKKSDLNNMETNQLEPDSKRDNTVSVNPQEDNLKVDMLYPPAPFPVFDQSNIVPSVDKNVNSNQNMNNAFKTNDQNQLLTANDIQKNFGTKSNINDIATDVVDNDVKEEQTPVELDYDLYADGNPSSEDLTQLSSQGLGDARIPLDLMHNDDQDRFVTDPNVQIINPGNQLIPRDKTINQNTFGTDTQNNVVDTATTGSLPSNGNILQRNIQQSNQDSQINGRFNNGNQQLNINQLKNPGIQNTISGSVSRTNGQLGSSILSNQFNQNIQTRSQQNVNNLPSDRFISDQNVISNRKQTVFTGVNPTQNNFVGGEIPSRNGQNNILSNGLLSRGQTSMNNVQNRANTANLPENNSNSGNSLNNNVNINNRMNTPKNVMNGNLNSNIPVNQRNNFINPNTINSNGNFNQISNPNNAGPQQNNMEIAVNPNLNQNVARNALNNAANPNLNQNVIRNAQRNAGKTPTLNQNIARNAQGNAINPMLNAREGTQPRVSNMGTMNVNSNLPLSQGQGFVNQGVAQTGNIGTSVPNVNLGNQVRNQGFQNGINSQTIRRNLNRGNGNFDQNIINLANNNLQNRPIVSGNTNGQVPPNNFQNIRNNVQSNINSFPSNLRSGQNFAQRFQNQNNFLGRPNNILNSAGNGLQRFGQNNGNLLQNQQNIGIFPNSVGNIQRNFQGSMPQFQNNLPRNMLNRNIQSVANNFGQSPPSSAFNNIGVNTFPNNVQFNSNPIRTNLINRQFGAFR